jgi:hypothetical protein
VRWRNEREADARREQKDIESGKIERKLEEG